VGAGALRHVELAANGEPYSWTACDIVKDLAKLELLEFNHEDIAKLIQRAIAACRREKKQ
jgi:hypothetical protein